MQRLSCDNKKENSHCTSLDTDNKLKTTNIFQYAIQDLTKE